MDPSLYAGAGLRSPTCRPSPRAVERFAHEGWTLRYAREGRTASIAVGESTRTGNRWLSINGKVDASTGDDMPTQVLSGQLPVAVHRALHPGVAPRVAVVGLASGVTAGSALDAGAATVDVIELEPRVAEAARFFEDVNHGVLDDPRTTLHIDDARALLSRSGPAWDVIVSEPTSSYSGCSSTPCPPADLQPRAHLPDRVSQRLAVRVDPGFGCTARGDPRPARRLPASRYPPLAPTLDPGGLARLGGRAPQHG